MKFEELKGLTIATIEGAEKGSQTIEITTRCGRHFQIYHQQDCCEDVAVEDVCGDVNDLINAPLMLAEESTNETDDLGHKSLNDESFTWTFYRLATLMGFVTIRWLGTSNGYYSESVDIYEITKENDDD